MDLLTSIRIRYKAFKFRKQSRSKNPRRVTPQPTASDSELDSHHEPDLSDESDSSHEANSVPPYTGTSPFPASDVERSEFELMLEEVTHRRWFGDGPRGQSRRLPRKIAVLLDSHCVDTRYIPLEKGALGRPLQGEKHDLVCMGAPDSAEPTNDYTVPVTVQNMSWESATVKMSRATSECLAPTIPPPLYAAAEDYIFSYISTVYPYFAGPRQLALSLRGPWFHRPNGNNSSASDLSCKEAHNWLNQFQKAMAGGLIRIRYLSGLLRPTQVQLIEIWIRAAIVEQTSLVRTKADGDLIWRRCQAMVAGLKDFFLKIRSERIELLLLKYIRDSEAGCNRDIGKAIAAASLAESDREKIQARRNYEGECSYWAYRHQLEELND